MPRSSRLDAPGVLHHVMGRGIERKEIFINKRDYLDFISRLAVRELGYSGAEVARYLGVSNSCVIRSVSTGKPSKMTRSP